MTKDSDTCPFTKAEDINNDTCPFTKAEDIDNDTCPFKKAKDDNKDIYKSFCLFKKVEDTLVNKKSI